MTMSIIFVICLASFLSATWGSNKIVVQLVHRNTLLPPQEKSEESDAIIAPLFAKDNRLFWANISIGEPPQIQLLVMDTGSELTWVGRAYPKFNPDSSSTFRALSCETLRQCNRYFKSDCRMDYSPLAEELRCVYEKTYADETSSKGILAFEKFTFISSTGGITVLPNVLFGFEVEMLNVRSPWLPGILGLSIGRSSLVSNLGRKFSYCIGDLTDPDYAYSNLILGDGAIFQGKWTPMKTGDGPGYLITIQGISIGETELDIDKSKFVYKVVLDTGSTASTLPDIELEKLTKEVRRLLDGAALTPAPVDGGLCYYGDIERDLKEFPTVTLHLANGVDLVLDVGRLFIPHSGYMFCLAFTRSTTRYHFLGVHAQQYYNIGVDAGNKRVFFQEISCELLLE